MIRQLSNRSDSRGSDIESVARRDHQLVFARIDLKPRIVCESRIEQAERMRKVHLLDNFEPVAVPDARRSSCPFADAVESKYHRLLEGRCEKRRRRVTLMMLGK